MKQAQNTYDLIIVGGGVTGFSAAMYGGRLKLKTLVIATIRGGTIILTNDIANWPGIKMTDGTSLAKQIEEHALSYEGVEVKDATVTSAKKISHGQMEGQGLFEVETDDGEKIISKSIIFATGTEWKKLGVKGEKEFANRGVHYCALCDGYFYKEKTVIVVGGADSAAKEAILLTQWAKKVYIVYRGDKIRPEPVNLTRVEQKVKEGKIEIIYNTNIVEFVGQKRLDHVLLDKEHKGSKEFKIDGVFVEIGHIPQSQLAVSLGVAVDKKNEIIIDRAAQTNVPGVFAAGDVVDTKFKQAITGSAEGVLAAYSAYEYLKKE